MAAQRPTPEPNANAILEELVAYENSFALKGALDLGLFTAIDDGARTASELAARLHANRHGIRVLCDFLVIRGHLTKQDGAYDLTLNSKVFLSGRSPAYLGSAASYFLHELTLANFCDLAKVVRRGGTITQDDFLEPDHPIWPQFAHAMTPVGGLTAEVTAELLAEKPATNVLDIAAGHGMFGIAAAWRNPQARVTAVDSAAVLECARKNAEKGGVSERYTTLPGDAFEVDFGSDYDLVLLANFLYYFDVETSTKLLRKIHAAMKPGGRLAIVGFVPNPDRISPPTAAGWALRILAIAKAGELYTFAQTEDMLRDAGFRYARKLDLTPSPQQLIVAVR